MIDTAPYGHNDWNSKMNNKKFLGILGVALLTLTQAANAQESGFRFLATGDLPYSPDQDATYRRLLKQSESEDFTFLMHVGDFKAQSAPCSDDEFLKIRDLFQAYPKPVVYMDSSGSTDSL